MTRDIEHWPAQSPSEDFAARTAEAMLRARVPAKATGLAPRRRLGLLALAAALLGASAWGAFEADREVARRSPTSAPTIAGPELELRASLPRVFEGKPPTKSAAPRAAKLPRRRLSAHPKSDNPEPTRPLPEPHELRTPRCECGPGAIVCGCQN